MIALRLDVRNWKNSMAEGWKWGRPMFVAFRMEKIADVLRVDFMNIRDDTWLAKFCNFICLSSFLLGNLLVTLRPARTFSVASDAMPLLALSSRDFVGLYHAPVLNERLPYKRIDHVRIRREILDPFNHPRHVIRAISARRKRCSKNGRNRVHRGTGSWLHC